MPWGQLKRKAIDKRPVEGPIRVHSLGVGDDEIVEERDHEITIDFLFRALTTERALIPALGAEPRLEPFVRSRLGERAARPNK